MKQLYLTPTQFLEYVGEKNFKEKMHKTKAIEYHAMYVQAYLCTTPEEGYWLKTGKTVGSSTYVRGMRDRKEGKPMVMLDIDH